MGAQGQRDNHESHEGEKWYYNNVSMGNETSHTYAYFKKRMEHCMAATLCLLFPYVRSHMIDLCLWEKSLTWEYFWQDMCYLSHFHLTPLILYYFQALEKLMAVRRWWDGHLLYYVLRQQEEEQCWSQWRDYCHHPIYQMTLSPCFFWSTYGDDNLFTICMEYWARRVPRVNKGNHEVPSIFWLHEDYIIAAQDQQLHINNKWRERQRTLNIITSHF